MPLRGKRSPAVIDRRYKRGRARRAVLASAPDICDTRSMKILAALVLGILPFVSGAAETVQMGSETFYLAEDPEAKAAKSGGAAKGGESAVLEYLPQGQTFATWRKLISVRRFPEIASPKAYLEKMVAEYRRQYPAMAFDAGKGPGGLYYLDCIMYPRDGAKARPGQDLTEWNYFVARSATTGIVVYQYAERFLGEVEASEIKALRARMLPVLRKSVFVSEAGK